MSRGEWIHPGGRNPRYPPPRPRWPGPAMTCLHCGLMSQTRRLRCPVCDTPYPRTRLRRALAWVRGSRDG